MKNKLFSKGFLSLQYALLIAVLVVLGFMFREQLEVRWRFLSNNLFPCQNPITYSIGELDTRFGISDSNFLKAIAEAEAIWEESVDKELFSYTPTGYLKINLVYDYRQDTTQTLQKLGFEVEQNRSSYDELKNNYKLTTSQFDIKKSAFEARIDALETRRSVYENDVKNANRQRGISKTERDRLTAEKEYLDGEIESINETRRDLQKEVEYINALASALNELARALNLDVANYNEVGRSFGSEFTQGVYESHGEGEGITIFQYSSYAKLVRVLAHELGHALSLEHLDNKDAIMYRLNEGDNDSVTTEDLLALKTHCGIK